MKVLFAVNNDKISEEVIKKYPKDYKELLSYKNVYYFNAILKEIQNDKSYDRIVISEDLEPFVNKNHDSIDNFLFNNLDKISDEAQRNDGREISIILICSERRSFGSNILNKLFSIGIYNALIGHDRSMDNLCKLINRPRNKKEAKIYYKIDQATYESAVDSGEVSEIEIQNILNHFKKLGKNTDRYTDSFNNIAGQYTDEQLKIIINVLPIKVKAVLESESDKYQSLMGVSGEKSVKQNTLTEPGISVNTIGSRNKNNVNGPIVIPSSIKRFTSDSKQIIPNNKVASKVQSVKPTPVVKQVQEVKKENKVQSTRKILEKQETKSNNIVEDIKTNKISKDVNEISQSNQITNDTENMKSSSQRYTGTISQVKRTLVARRKTDNLNSANNIVSKTDLDDSAQNIVEENIIQEPKRGRGRPKKVVETQEVKTKGKRGRPKKLPIEEENDLDDLLNNINTDKEVLPGMNEDDLNDNVLPGVDEDNEVGEEVDVNDLLAGLEEESEDDLLPGLEEESEDDLLPGLEEEGEDDLLPGLEEESEDDLLPGLEEESEDDLLPGLEEEGEDDLLPGLEESEDDLLPGLDASLEQLDELENSGFNINNDDFNNNIVNENTSIESIKPQIDYSTSNLNSLLSKDKKIVSFVGTTKNGTSFLINNLALMLSMMGINTAILDMTKNKNSYYLFTDSREELRKIAYTSLSKLENGYADGIKYNKNLTVYTALPTDNNVYENAEPILSTLVQNHSLVLIDTDFNTPPAYFASSQEIYLVQSMDAMTIQPLTEFLRDLKFKGAWEPEKARVVINKEIQNRVLTKAMIVGGMSRYTGADMSIMTDLFNKDMVSVCSIPFDEKVYGKYLETLATCKLSISSLPKVFRSKLELLANMVYPRLNDKTSYNPSQEMGSNSYNVQSNTFSNNTNNILNKMKKKF